MFHFCRIDPLKTEGERDTLMCVLTRASETTFSGKRHKLFILLDVEATVEKNVERGGRGEYLGRAKGVVFL